MQLRDARGRYIQWLRTTKDLSPHTLRAYDADILAFERHLGRTATVTSIRRDNLVAFVEVQRVAGISPTSLKRRASGIRGFCKWLVSADLLESDPFQGAVIASVRSRRLPKL
jgi:integrase/recombinase XerC